MASIKESPYLSDSAVLLIAGADSEMEITLFAANGSGIFDVSYSKNSCSASFNILFSSYLWTSSETKT